MPDPNAAPRDEDFATGKDSALRHLTWPRRLTQIGMTAERFARAFWPLWCVLALGLVVVIFEIGRAHV